MSRNILIPVDDSDAAENVVGWVLDNIYREGDELHLLHIIPIPMPEVITGGFGAMDSIVTVDPDPKEDLKHIADAKEMMKKRFVTTLASKDVRYQVEIIHFLTDTQSIGEAICKRADGLKATIVCMAKHNRGKISEFFLGSTSKYCTVHCPCPLIVVSH